MRQKIELQKQKNKTFDEGYDEFILNCKVKNYSPATIKHYDGIINHVWYKFIDYKTPIQNITPATIQDFIVFMRKHTNSNDVTVNTNIRAIRAILYYFMKLGYMDAFKISEIKVNKDIIETYTDEEIRILLKKPDLKKCNYIEYRNWCIINFLLACGCRERTLVNIKIGDLDFENDLVTYTHTKNRKQQIIPMSNTLKQVLIEYLQYRQGKEDDYLFVSAYGNKIDENRLSHSLNQYNKNHGIMKTGVHRFRHTFAKKWILNNGDIFRLQKLLGHSDLEVVKNYVEMFTNDLQKDFNVFNPLESMNINKKHISMKR